MRKTIIILAIGLIIVIVGSAILGRGCTAPKTTEEVETLLTYKVKAGFNHQAYRQPTKEQDTANPKHFAKIVDTILVSYRYKFLPSEPVSRVTGHAEISAVVKSPGMWEKEVPLVETKQIMGDFSTNFPLIPSDFAKLADDIAKEIGVGTHTPIVVLKSTVHTEAETESGVLTEDFIQTCQVNLGENVYEWYRPFSLSRKGYWEGMTYEQQGEFGYAVTLKPNILFGAVTLHSSTAGEEAPLVKAASAASYPADTTKTMDVTLFCRLDSDKPVSQVRNEVEVNAVLIQPKEGGISFELVPKQQLEGNSSVTFPLDMELLYDITGAAKGEGGSADEYRLMISANVHTVAQTEFGVINEVLNPSINLMLKPTTIGWPEMPEETASGSFEETVIVTNPDRGTTITAALGVLGMGLAVLLYGAWSYREAKQKQVPIPIMEEEAIQVKKKHKDIIVDVQTLPPRGGQVLIHVDSIDELVKVADALLKPILHKAEADKHTYNVTDGLTLYEYVGLENIEPEDSNSLPPS